MCRYLLNICMRLSVSCVCYLLNVICLNICMKSFVCVSLSVKYLYESCVCVVI